MTTVCTLSVFNYWTLSFKNGFFIDFLDESYVYDWLLDFSSRLEGSEVEAENQIRACIVGTDIQYTHRNVCPLEHLS